MFESIVLRRAENGLPVSAGQIAEALLYYQSVHLVIDRGTLLGLFRTIGPARLISLLKRPGFSAVHCEESLATYTQSIGAFQVHSYIAFSFAGRDGVAPLNTRVDRLQYELELVGTPKREARKFAQVFADRVPARKLSGDAFVKGGVTAAARRELLDPEFALKAMRRAVAAVDGGYDAGSDLKFDVVDSELGAHVFTNINFDAINCRRAASTPPQEPIAVAHLLSSLLDSTADLAMASFYGGDFSTSSATSQIIQVRHDLILRRASLNRSAREQFSEVVLPDSPSVAEVIDSGERSFDDFLLLLDKAMRFKTWLKSVNPDDGLIRSYLRDVTSDAWIQQLPVKTLRYLFTLGLDASNPVAGVAAGILDTFILEKLLGGWRPNHFVDRRLASFIKRTF